VIKVVRVLLLACLVHPMVHGTSVAAVQRPGAPRTRQAAAKRTASKRPPRPRLRVRSARPLRTRRVVLPGSRRLRAPVSRAPRTSRTVAPVAPAPRDGRLRRFTRWTGRVLSVRGALRAIERVFAFVRPGQRVGDLSASGLTVAGSRSIGAVQPALAAVSGVAGVTLAAASALELARARNHIERADAAHGIAWGLQSVGGIGSMWWHAPGWFEPMAFSLGLGGGAIQTAVGMYRLRTGLAARDRRTIILGVLDTGAGASWIASTVTGNPIALAAFFGLTGVRLLYTNAPRLKALAQRAARGVSRLLDRASSKIDRFTAGRPRLARNWR
jgi:hypothetical protein